MADKEVKISELPESTSMSGLYTIGVNSQNESVKVPFSLLQGERGYGVAANVSRDALTEAQWALYGTSGRNEEWSGTSGTRNGCRTGDLFTVSGTSTDGGRAHFLLFRSTTATGNLVGDCIGHTTAERGKAATVSVGTVTTGEAGSDATVTNSGTEQDAVLDFKIPKGEQGESAVNVVQGTGTSTADVMSQMATSQNAVKPFVYGMKIGANVHFKLTEKQIKRINETPVITVILGYGNWTYGRYQHLVADNMATKTIDGTTYCPCLNIRHTSGEIGSWHFSSNQDYVSVSERCFPLNNKCLNIFVWNKKDGIVRLYNEKTLVGTLQRPEYKFDNFVKNGLFISGGDTNLPITRFSIIEGDASLNTHTVFDLDTITPDNLIRDWDYESLSPVVTDWYKQWTEQDDGTYRTTGTAANNNIALDMRGYNTGQFYCYWKKVKINSGTKCRFMWHTGNILVWDSNGDLVSDTSSTYLTEGETYDIFCSGSSATVRICSEEAYDISVLSGRCIQGGAVLNWNLHGRYDNYILDTAINEYVPLFTNIAYTTKKTGIVDCAVDYDKEDIISGTGDKCTFIGQKGIIRNTGLMYKVDSVYKWKRIDNVTT